MGCTRVEERVAAAFGKLKEARVEFPFALDVRFGGVLFALPALLINGLLRHSEKHFSLPNGFYGLSRIFILIAFMALCRIKSIEGLRRCPPGDLGKLLGLDRVPEVRTLREKLEHLCERGAVSEWSADLSRDWMAGNPDLAGYLYVDGHVRVYHGRQTKLPKRYVARERLCLRGTTDYWVNDALGQPFFSVNAPVNPGLLEIIRREIVPRLEQDVPNQPSEAELEANPWLFRFALVFDREGYSPDFFLEMLKKRIVCYTYRKYQSEDWDRDEFSRHEVKFPNGEVVELELAERGTLLGRKIWVREIRKLTSSGHQTALVTTDFLSDAARIAGSMFSRWSQENFFKYMMQHFGIDKLLEYKTEPIAETTRVVNPAYRELDGKIRSNNSKLARRKAKFGAIVLEGELEREKVEEYGRQKAGLQEEISFLQKETDELKARRKECPRHISFAELPEGEQFSALANDKKQIVDTIKMIAYRAETALANLIKPYMTDKREARSLLRQIFTSEADLKPDEENKTLTVSLHNLTNPVSDRIVRNLCQEINATKTIFPGSNLRLVYKLVSDQIRPNQVI
jgi:Transposase protein